jgi:MFS family permease
LSWAGLLLSVFQQFVGINVIFYYSNLLWEAVGFTEQQAFITTVIGATINVLTTFIAIATVDRFGRKPLLLIGSVGMTITLATMAIIFGTARVEGGIRCWRARKGRSH